jgi:hypothetical protein
VKPDLVKGRASNLGNAQERFRDQAKQWRGENKNV